MSPIHLRARQTGPVPGRPARPMAHGIVDRIAGGTAGAGRRRVPRAAQLALLVAVAGSLAGCTSNAFTRLGMPKPITTQGKLTLTLWQGSWIAALAVGVLVWGLVIWTVVFFRKRSDELPPQVRYNLPIEVLYTVVPFIMVAVLFYFTARDENTIDKLSARPDVVVNVTGFQWSWEFQYPQYGIQVVGQPVNTATIESYAGPRLVLPQGETVRFNLTSPDVIHSFWVPAFLFKRDVIPGHPNHFQITTTTTGTFSGRCSELCGLYHSEMLFTVKVVSKPQFQRYVAAQKLAQRSAAGSVQ